MIWSIEQEFELDEYIVESRLINGRHERIEYRLVRKTRSKRRSSNSSKDELRDGNRRIASKQQLLSLHDYISRQFEKLPLFEYGDESEHEELERYRRLYAASDDYFRIYKKLNKRNWQLEYEEVAEWIYAWSVYLEILYEKRNNKLRKRFLKNEKYKNQIKIEKQNQTKSKKLPISKQHEKSLIEPRLDNYTFKTSEKKSPYHQFKELEKGYSKQYPKFTFQYLRNFKTLYLNPKQDHAVEFKFDELDIVKHYFSKPRVLRNLSDADKALLETHFRLEKIVINKQCKKTIDFELLKTWLEIYKIWEKNKVRYRKLCDDYRNNKAQYT